jgi:nicotinamidase-related amidase
MKTLLILIDLQHGWRHKTATESTMQRCIELAQEFTGDKILSCFKHEPGGFIEKQLNWKRFENDRDTGLIPEAAKLRLPMYWRRTYNCITPEVERIVKQYDRIYLAGVFTDISVFVTAAAIFDMGIPVTVVKDCVATLHGETIHTYALRSLEHMIDRKNVLYSDELPEGVLQENPTD